MKKIYIIVYANEEDNDVTTLGAYQSKEKAQRHLKLHWTSYVKECLSLEEIAEKKWEEISLEDLEHIARNTGAPGRFFIVEDNMRG